MNYRFNENISKDEYDAFLENYSMAPLNQNYNWCLVKKEWNAFHCGLYEDDKLVGVCLALKRRIIRSLSMIYVPRGYCLDFTNKEHLDEFTKGMKALAKRQHAYMVKIDPNFCNSDEPFDQDMIVEHNYSLDKETKHQNLVSSGYKYQGIKRLMGQSFQPQYNIFAPACDSDNNILDSQSILSSYNKKVKYYLNNFHEKRGVSFEITQDANRISDLVTLLKKTEEKHNILLRNEEYFHDLMKAYDKQAYLIFGYIDLNKYLAFNEVNKNEKEAEMVKEDIQKYGDKILSSASLFIMPFNKQGIRTSEYLYAGNESLYSKLRVSDGLVYEIIKFSANNGCHYCNLGGVEGTLDDHLTDFKRKFNSRVMEFIGEYDLVINPLYYPIKWFYPVLLKIYHKIRNAKINN